MKNKKIFSIILTLICCFSIVNPIYATGGIIGEVKPTLGEYENATDIARMVSESLGYLQFGCWAVAIGMIIYIGIKYMMSAANERADLKGSSIRYVVGALMIGAASSVFTIIWNIVYGLGNGTGQGS